MSGLNDNQARQWRAEADFKVVLDSGPGGEAANFDTIAFRALPNPRPAADLWPLETNERTAREARTHQLAGNAAYHALGMDECGRLLVAGTSVAVPFVGALSACVVLAEMLKCTNRGPIFSELKLRLCSLGKSRPLGRLCSPPQPLFVGYRCANDS